MQVEVDHGEAELVSDPDRPRSWTLFLDGTAQSHVDLDDPTHLEFEYVRRIGHVIDAMAEPSRPLHALHLGGGAWTLARYVATTRPGSVQRVVELDGALAEVVRTHLPADGLDIAVTIGDARAALSTVPPGSLDLLVLDAFVGARTPAHLTSTQFVGSAAAALAADGIYAANIADGGLLDFARSQVAAATATFDEVALVVSPDVLHGRRFGNLVLVAAHRPLPEATLTRRIAADPFPARLLTGVEVVRFAGDAVAPTDRAATPSPVPPPGFFGQT